ncbi:hypothetical protein UlMin_042560 [Ulmus minor]
MGRSLSPILQRELENLDRDADSRRSAMKTLKSYVKDLDSKAIPQFLAQVSQTNEVGSLAGQCTISLYEVLARVHGIKIVPMIDRIMTSIIKTLASNAVSFPLQLACSKVVPAIARYGIDPTTPEEQKRHIIHSLCNPLLDSLLGSQESLTSGAALCLKALVDSDNWRFASDEMVNKVCQNVAGALEEKTTQSNAHMNLVIALVKRNALMVEPYARLLIQAGLRILNAGILDGNSQKRLSAIQMINVLMKCLDPRSTCSELQFIIVEMEKCKCDSMPYVKGAAFQALQTARRIAAEKGSNSEEGPGSVSCFSRRRNLSSAGNQSPLSVSPESQTLNSFVDNDSFVESPISTMLNSQNLDYDGRSVNGRLWSCENGGVDMSLRDGIFSEFSKSRDFSNIFSKHSGNSEFAKSEGNYGEEFLGCLPSNPRNRMCRSTATSPVRSRTQINVYRTPRRLVRSLQDPYDMNHYSFEKQARRSRNLSPSDFEQRPSSRYERHCASPDEDECGENESLYAGGEQFQVGAAESVSSTDGIPNEENLQASHVVISGNKTDRQKVALRLLCGLSLGLLAVISPLFWLSNQEEGCYLVPT